MNTGTAIGLAAATAVMLPILSVRAWLLRRVWDTSSRNGRLLAAAHLAEIALFILLIWTAFLTRSPWTWVGFVGVIAAMAYARRALGRRIAAEEVQAGRG